MYTKPRKHITLLPPPPANARSAVWRAFYLEHDLYEAANLAPAFPVAGRGEPILRRVGEALERVSPLVAAAAVESHTSFTLVRGLSHLRHLTLSHFKRQPEDNAARAVPVTSAEEVLGALKERRALDALSSLWLVDAQLAAAEVAKVIGLVGSSRLQVAAALRRRRRRRAAAASPAPPAPPVRRRLPLPARRVPLTRTPSRARRSSTSPRTRCSPRAPAPAGAMRPTARRREPPARRR